MNTCVLWVKIKGYLALAFLYIIITIALYGTIDMVINSDYSLLFRGIIYAMIGYAFVLIYVSVYEAIKITIKTELRECFKEKFLNNDK